MIDAAEERRRQARETGDSIFGVRAGYVGLSRYGYDMQLADAFEAGAKWAFSQNPPTPAERAAMRAVLGRAGVVEADTDRLIGELFDVLMHSRLDPEE